jgi:hypothetical protein
MSMWLIVAIAILAGSVEGARRNRRPAPAAARVIDEETVLFAGDSQSPLASPMVQGRPKQSEPETEPRAAPPPPPPVVWANDDAPGKNEEIFNWQEETTGKRHYVNAIAWREWQRWEAWVKYADDDWNDLVPVNLDVFPRVVWDQVLQMCAMYRHSCQLDSAIGDLQELKQRCTYCFENRGELCTDKDPSRCHPAYCDRCTADKATLLSRLTAQGRKVTARVVANEQTTDG